MAGNGGGCECESGSEQYRVCRRIAKRNRVCCTESERAGIYKEIVETGEEEE
mgnify:CR=1 FL=1